jgi:hypothetical protein
MCNEAFADVVVVDLYICTCGQKNASLDFTSCCKMESLNVRIHGPLPNNYVQNMAESHGRPNNSIQF